jgi:hypothetical protein
VTRFTLSSGSQQRPALVAALAGLGAITCFVLVLFPGIYWGAPPSIAMAPPAARCQASPGAAPCTTTVVRLNPGRFRIAASSPGASIEVTIADRAAAARARVLAVRASGAGRLRVLRAADPATSIAELSVHAPDARLLVAIPESAGEWDTIDFTPAPGFAAALDELGFFADSHGLAQPAHQPFSGTRMRIVFLRLMPFAALAICGAMIGVISMVPRDRARSMAPWLAAVLCLGICLLDIGVTFSPHWSLDLRAAYAKQWLPERPGANLIGGLQEGVRVVQGHGLTIADGFVQWHRMPGYGLLCAALAGIAGVADLIDLVPLVVVAQCLLYSVAVGVFVSAALRLFPPTVAFLVGIAVILLPKQLAYTQADSIIAPLQLVVIATLLRYLAEERDGRPATFPRFLEVNLAFALWFFVRTDVLPGWFIVSALLAGRRWRRLALPVVLALLIAVPWGLYKRPYRHEFTLLPTNAGEVLMLGLCEVPGAFPYECGDDGYFSWARRNGHVDAATGSASAHATAEAIRHWVTYPVHFVFMVLTKAYRAVMLESFPGFQTRFNLPFSGVHPRAGGTHLFLALLLPLAAAFAAGYERRRTLLVAWALFFNMPLFFVMFASDGRFYAAAGVSLVAAAVPLLCDAGFYRAVRQRPRRAAAATACVLAFVLSAVPFERWVAAHDAVHYWSPLLDPAKSSLRFPPP